ncbi:MAG: hypothetical protein VKJ64_14570 [Leptolyngbyaceae bacterium]|nr:hypothetical protein [Leptolyngbyaceae bacterium]
MNTTAIRSQIQSYVEQLSAEKLTVVLDFLAYLVERESNEATAELLSMPGLLAELEQVESQLETDTLADWRNIRHDV